MKHHAAVQTGADHFAAGDNDAALGGIVEPHGDRQNRRLAAARMADDADKLAVADAQVKVFDDDRGTLFGIVAFAKLSQFECGNHEMNLFLLVEYRRRVGDFPGHAGS